MDDAQLEAKLDQIEADLQQAIEDQRAADMIEAMCQNNILTMGRYQQRVTENARQIQNFRMENMK